VEAHIRQPGPFKRRLETTVHDVGGVQRRAYPRGEDEVLILIEAARPQLLLSLPGTVSPQRLHGRAAQPNGTAVRVLGGGEDEAPLPRTSERPLGERDYPFPDYCVGHAKRFGYCLLKTSQIFQALSSHQRLLA
jgi:hypothetical protein